MSRPKLSRHGKKVQILRASNRRQNVSVIYPYFSRNGSTVTIDGTDHGLRISWIGGKSLYQRDTSEEPTTNGDHSEATTAAYSQSPHPDDEALFESDEEDSDDDLRQASVIQDIEIHLGSPVQSLAIPSSFHQRDNRHGTVQDAALSQGPIIVSVACEDGSAKVLTLPLEPPSSASKRKRTFGVHVCSLETALSGAALRTISLTLDESQGQRGTARSQLKRSEAQPHSSFTASLLAAVTTSEIAGRILFFTIPLSGKGHETRLGSEQVTPFHSTYLDGLPTASSFNPSHTSLSRHSQLLVSDVSGSTSVFDLSPDSNDPARSHSRNPDWLIHFSAPYTSAPEPSLATTPHRRKVVDAKWCLDGTAALVLIEDGTFGLYNVTASAPASKNATPSPLSFALSGFVGDAPENSAPSALAVSGSKPKRAAHLAPMTPNTRRTKSENLFSGSPRQVSGGALSGGIATLPIAGKHEKPDDAVVLWYGKRLFAIPSLMAYWTRFASRDAGSLYGAGITVLDEVDLSNEVIVSVNILPSRASAEPQVLGPAAWKHIVQVTGEYKTVVLSTARPRGTRPLAMADDSPSRADRRLLQEGELGLDAMDRMLDSMVGVEQTSRKVGFLEN